MNRLEFIPWIAVLQRRLSYSFDPCFGLINKVAKNIVKAMRGSPNDTLCLSVGTDCSVPNIGPLLCHAGRMRCDWVTCRFDIEVPPCNLDMLKIEWTG